MCTFISSVISIRWLSVLVPIVGSRNRAGGFVVMAGTFSCGGGWLGLTSIKHFCIAFGVPEWYSVVFTAVPCLGLSGRNTYVTLILTSCHPGAGI